MTQVDWNGLRRQRCPNCGRTDRDKTLGVTLKGDGSCVAHCFRCDHVETLRYHRSSGVNVPGRRPIQRRVPERPATLSEHWSDFFARLEPLAGPALAYLQARRCMIPPADSDLRWHEALRHPCGHVGPALVALVTDARTREPLTLHRTWIQRDGTKAPKANPPRMLLGGHRKAGGVIRLWPDEAVTTGLAVAEGIETALSLAHVYRPAWACIDAGNLAVLPVLAGVECLVIGADHDSAGLRAASACAERWSASGVDVAAVMPRGVKKDLNDLRDVA